MAGQLMNCALAVTLVLLLVATDLVDSEATQHKLVKRQTATQILCPESTLNVQDPADCSRYYECSNNVVTPRACVQGQVFNPLSGNCGNFQNPLGCVPSSSQGTLGSNPPVATYLCPGPRGRYQDTSDCSRFYSCINSAAQRNQCPAGQRFDPNAEACSSTSNPTGCHITSNNPAGGQGEFQCPNGQGKFHDSTDCTRYYVCSYWQPTRTQCPAGQLFDPTDVICSSTATPVGCHRVQGGVRQATIQFRCPSAYGNYQDVTDCSRFWRCSNNQATNTACPVNQLFDTSTFQCSRTITTVSGCTMPTRQIPVSPGTGNAFVCPRPNGNYQDINDCSRYWRCVNSVAINTPCQANQLFDTRTLQCSSTITTATGCRMPQTPAGTQSFVCPSPNGNYQDITDCSRYWRCVNSVAINTPCQANQLFDTRTLQCSSTISTATGCRMPQTPAGTQSFRCPTANGNYQDTTDCSRYWVCFNNIATNTMCPVNQLFDIRTAQCSSSIFFVPGCTMPTTTGSFRCPTANGNYQDTTDCSRYWRCTANQPTNMPCPVNQLFDPRTFQCSSLITTVAGCTMPPGRNPSTTVTGSFRCPTANGNYQDITDCSRYWRCTANQPTSMACPVNQLFDPRTFQCSSLITTVAGCTMPPGRNPSGNFRCPTANGNYQDITDCSRYWRCTANQPTSMACPVNQLFDPRTFQCSSLITTVAGCTMPPGRNPSGSFRCPTANGNYQDITDCSRYWRCTANQPTSMACPVNQLFDPRTFQCSSLITTVAGCTMPPGRNPSGSFRCPTANGNYQDITDCSRYWRCTANQPTSMACPVNQLFDPRTFQCSSLITTVAGCTMPPGRNPSGSFRCPTANGNYQDITDCSRYWRCTANQPTSMACPVNQLFDPRTFQCSSLITTVAGCTMPPGRNPSGSFSCPTANGNYQDITDCSRYWRCTANQPTSMACPVNQLFDPRTFQCSSLITSVAGCTMPPGRNPSGSFRCPAANGNYQDTTDCSRYWRCTANQPTSMACPVNQLFDPRTFQCSSLITTVPGCTMPPGRNPTSFSCLAANANYQDVTDCSRYWRCTNFQATNMRCPVGSLFDTRANECSSAITTVSGCTMPGANPSYVCPRPSGEFSYPADCSRYWRCDNNNASLRRCTGNLLFNAERGYCDSPTALGSNPRQCRLMPAQPLQPTGEATCGRSTQASNIPHPRLCNAFYICGDGRLYRPCVFCGGGTYFDQATQVCISARNIDMLTVCPGKVMMPHANKTQAQADGC
ncbi:hypothetical protein RRG08_064200 [Elysia crispata]|uniref:Chitin-binding type-2 domain-containing protein n=1 Tax=Elysia crispata TaxID=231223 RepID=A0AAE1AS27_9GAST|nr:hypothetical protein RRG08_064200 [Elysia crispata]